MRRIGTFVFQLLDLATSEIIGKYVLIGGQVLVVQGATLIVILQPIAEAALAEPMTTRRKHWLIQPVNANSAFVARIRIVWIAFVVA